MPNILQTAKNVFSMQTQGIIEMEQLLDTNFELITKLIATCRGHVVVSGVGKSGNIATKIVASMSSLGIPSIFLEAANAGHGDLGVITKECITILISNSGESLELLTILEHCHNIGVTTIAITRGANSTLATNAKHSLTIPQTKETHEFAAPTTSTTQTLVLGDALTVCASQLKGFTKKQYAQLHPSGNLGMKIAKAHTIMNTQFCIVENNTNAMDVLKKMSQNSNGFVCVVEEGKLCGIVTDGDIRRFLIKNNKEISTATAKEIATQNPKTILEEEYIINAVEIIQKHKTNNVIVVNSKQMPVGFIARNQFKM